MFNYRSPWTRFVIAGLLLAAAVSFGVRGRASAEDDAGRLQQVTSTPGGQLTLPSATPSPIGGATATPSHTPTAPVVLIEAVGEANLRSGPGLDFDVIGTISAGDPVRVVGRSPNFPWYVVEWPGGPGDVAWVFDELVIVHGDITTQPIYPDPVAPTVDPTQAAIQATATVLLQTPGAAETATATALFEPTGVFTSTPGAEGIPGAESDSPPPQFTAPAPDGSANGVSPVRDPTASGATIPPAMVIITLGGLGILALIVSVLRR
jgi:hypothetical protein